VGRLRRVALWFGAAIVGLFAVALLIVNLYVQSHQAQASIQQELSRRLQTPIQIRSVAVTPWGGLTLTGITISQVSNVTTNDFLQASSFHLHVRLLPLFSRQLIIKEVSLLSPTVVWAQTPDGKWRLPGSEARSSAAAGPTVGPEPGAAPAGEPANPPLSTAAGPPTATAPISEPARAEPKAKTLVLAAQMRRINVTDGNFRFLDRSGATVASFEGVRFHSSVRTAESLRGSVSVAKISIRDRCYLQHLESPLRYDPEELALPKISARLGSGDVNGEFSLQSQAADSPFKASIRFRGVQADEIVVEAGGPKGVIQGKLEGSLEASGKTADATAVTGRGEISLHDGQLQQYSLLVALGQILQIEELTQLQLQQADAKYHIDPGVVTVDSMVLRSPNIRLSSTGTVGFNGKLRLQSQLAINDKVRSQLFSPIRDNFQPIDEPGYAAVDFQVNGTIDRPKTNLVEKVVGRNLKDFVNGLLGGSKPDRPKRKRLQEPDADAPEGSPEPTRNPDARMTPP